MGPKSLSDRLPDEVLLHIISFLEPPDITRLQLVSRYFKSLARDDNFWRQRCFDESSYLEHLRLRSSQILPDNLSRDVSRSPIAGTSPGYLESRQVLPNPLAHMQQANREKTRIMANWDPSYPTERVSWFDEYIQRHGPVAVNWLQQPEIHDGSVKTHIEVRGVALYHPDRLHGQAGRLETVLAVSPLDDGSVGIWDINGTRGKRGAMLAKSRPGILFLDGPGADNKMRSKRIDSGVTECVSVDSQRHRAFFAVQSHLIEVDLRRLSVVDCTSFPWSITTMSEANRSVPLTIGTTLGIHLHDYRTSANYRDEGVDGVDDLSYMTAQAFYERSLRELFDDKPLPPMASLSYPGPLSVLHLTRPGSEADLSDDIYVAGRFSNILHYDRRKFSSIKGSIHSGGRLCSLTALPCSFSALTSELRRKGELSKEQVDKSKNMEGGRTIIACGEYGTKGSLELYGLSSTPSPNMPGGLQNSVMKNRQSASTSKLLSVVNHGTRLACADGSGLITWFERDGFTEVRRSRIGHSEPRQETSSLFFSMESSDDIARKLLPTRAAQSGSRINDNDLLFWTGEKLGLVTFSTRLGFTAESFEEQDLSSEEEEIERQEKAFNEMMRQALEREADNVRLVRNLW